MHARKRLANVIDQIVTSETQKLEEVVAETSTIDEYKKLNEKCDVVIDKIKTRKGKKTSQQAGE